MKTSCLLNFLSLIFVLACNFETSDLPYFNGILQDVYLNLVNKVKLAIKSLMS